jgi:hypothetical protein
VGTCSLTAHVAAGSSWGAANGTPQTFQVAAATAAASISNLPPGGSLGGGFTPSVSTASDGTTSVTSSTPSVCAVGGAGVQFLAAGQCTLVAHVAAGTDYLAADGTPQAIKIGGLIPTAPTIANLPLSEPYGGYFMPSVTTSGDGVTSVTSNSTAVCTVGASGKVNIVGVGTCSLTAHVAVGTRYAASDGAPQTFVTGQTVTNVAIGNLPSSEITTATYTPSVSTTGDGTTSVTSSTPTVCTVSGGSVAFVGVGTCTLTAHVAAGTNYQAADGVPQSFVVSTGAVPLIIDTDMFSDAGDAGALSAAFALQQLGEANVVATVVDTRANRPSVPDNTWKCVAAIAQYYGATQMLLGSDQPTHGTDVNSPDWTAPCAAQASISTPAPDTAVATYRKALAGQPNHSVVIAGIGYFENLQALIQSPADSISPLTGMQLVQQKVKQLVVMDGCFPTPVSGSCATASNPYNNSLGNPTAASYVAANWPTKVVWSGYEFGDPIHTGQTISSVQPPFSPVRAAYEAYVGPGNWIYSYDLATLYDAVRPNDSAFSESGPGTNAITSSTGANTWTAGSGNQYFLSLNNATGLDSSIESLLDVLPLGPLPNETFDAGVLDPHMWQTVSTGSSVAAANQELEITHPAGSWTTGSLVSQLPFDLTGKAIQIQVTHATNGGQSAPGGTGGETTFEIRSDASHYVGFFIGGGGIGVHLNTGAGGTNIIGNWVPYNATSMQWFRIRESGGTIYFDVAPGATAPGAWTTVAQTQDPFSVNGVRLRIVAGSDLGSADTATFDNLTTG